MQQDGGGVIYPARPGELMRWAAVATVASGVAYCLVTWFMKHNQGKNKGHAQSQERAILFHGVVYGLVVVFLATVAGLDASVVGFGPTRVVIHLAAICVTVVMAVVHARKPREPRDGSAFDNDDTKGNVTYVSYEVYAGALYGAALLSVMLI